VSYWSSMNTSAKYDGRFVPYVVFSLCGAPDKNTKIHSNHAPFRMTPNRAKLRQSGQIVVISCLCMAQSRTKVRLSSHPNYNILLPSRFKKYIRGIYKSIPFMIRTYKWNIEKYWLNKMHIFIFRIFTVKLSLSLPV
jgi:hypothetical protein